MPKYIPIYISLVESLGSSVFLCLPLLRGSQGFLDGFDTSPGRRQGADPAQESPRLQSLWAVTNPSRSAGNTSRCLAQEQSALPMESGTGMFSPCLFSSILWLLPNLLSHTGKVAICPSPAILPRGWQYIGTLRTSTCAMKGSHTPLVLPNFFSLSKLKDSLGSLAKYSSRDRG